MRKALVILSLVYQLLFTTLWSQSNYPVYVSPSLIPPYSLKLSDYGAFGSQRLMVTIVVNDLDVANLPVKLRIRMETAGVTIENPPTINTTPIFLDGGSATILFGEELADYFSISNLQFKGYSKEAYRVSGQLPEGFYRFTVEVLHFHTNRVISNAGTTTAWIALGKPPVLRMPANNVELGEYAGMPITFSWLSSSVGSPVSAGSIRYRFEMWEMRIPGISPYSIAASMPLFHEYTTGSTFYSLNPASLMMEEGMSYVWRVTAYDESGFVPFEQDGRSEVRTFSYKSLCRGVTAIETSVAGQKGSFVWVPEGNHTSYNVEVRNNASGWFSAGETFNSKVEYYELERGQTYELRVQSVCNGNPGSTGDYSPWTALTISDAKPQVSIEDCPGCGCDDDIPKVELTNFELRRNLSAGDTLSNKTGTTRFIVRSAEPQGDGIYKGLFYFWAEIWGAKILCEYWDLQVNSDNVIVNMDFRSINDPRFLLDVDAAIGAVAGLLDNVAVLTSDGTIRDTIQVLQDFDYIEVKDGQLVAIVLDENGDPVPTPLNISVEEAEKALITNGNGDEAVITSKGEVMGAKEYQATGGGNSRLMKNYNKEKESNDLAESGMVEFSAHPGQKYGFDAYTEQKQAILNNYPTLNNGYRPAFKSVESFGYDKVGVSSREGLTFRDEMGVPAADVGEGVSVRGSNDGSVRALYAYRDGGEKEEIVGKLNVMSFDNQPMRVYIVPVNDAHLPSARELQQTLNEVYRQAVTTWTVVEEPGITISFPDGKMTHGGSGDFDTYNTDQKLIVETYTSTGRQLERNALYLFFVEGVTFKERSIAGFMPLQRQAGFIYDNPGLVTVAHELAHGAFNLRHTFSPQSFIVSEGQTQNLMDYTGGTELWKYQWDLIHNPERILFSWAQDEEEGEFKGNTPIEKVVNTIEMLRCGFVSNRKVKFEKNVFFSWLKESVTVRDFNGLYDGNTYKYIHIQLLDDSKLIEYPADLQLAESDSYFNSLLKLARGEVLKLDFGGLVILVDKDNAQNLLEYLTPTEHQYRLQQRQFVQSIADLFDKQFYTREKVINILKVSPQCLYESLTQDQRLSLLSLINNNSNIPETVENIVIDIIRTTPDEQIEYLFDNLHTTGLLAYFDRVMNNVGSSNDNYTRFIYELLKLYLKQFSDNLNCFEATPWGQLYVDNQVRSVGNFNYIYETPYYWWRKGCKVPTWRYGNRGVFISDHNTCGYFNKENVEIDPFEPVVIYFEEDLSFYELPPELESRIVSMPAFVLPWLRNEASNKEAMRMAGNAVTIVESFTPLGATGKVASGLRGILIKAFVYINKVDATINVLLTNEAIKESISKIGDGKGKEFLDQYEKISLYFTLGSPTIQGLLSKKSLGDIALDYVDLSNSWRVIMNSSIISNSLTQKEIESVSNDILSVIEILENENIVE